MPVTNIKLYAIAEGWDNNVVVVAVCVDSVETDVV